MGLLFWILVAGVIYYWLLPKLARFHPRLTKWIQYVRQNDPPNRRPPSHSFRKDRYPIKSIQVKPGGTFLVKFTEWEDWSGGIEFQGDKLVRLLLQTKQPVPRVLLPYAEEGQQLVVGDELLVSDSPLHKEKEEEEKKE